METKHKEFQISAIESPRHSDRFVCHSRKSSAPTVCSPEYRPTSSGSGCDDNGLESVEIDLPLSSSESFNESARKTKNLQGQNSLDCTNVAEIKLVSSDSGTQTSAVPFAGPSVDTISTEEKCLRYILANRQSSYMDFLKVAREWRRGIEPVHTDFSESHLAPTSKRQYSSGWKKFVNYIHTTRPNSVTVNTCVGFFKHLHEKGLASTTVCNVKSQITKAIWEGFGIDFGVSPFDTIKKACARLRSDPPPKKISWSLNKVLERAVKIPVNCSNLSLVTKKLAFFGLSS